MNIQRTAVYLRQLVSARSIQREEIAMSSRDPRDLEESPARRVIARNQETFLSSRLDRPAIAPAERSFRFAFTISRRGAFRENENARNRERECSRYGPSSVQRSSKRRDRSKDLALFVSSKSFDNFSCHGDGRAPTKEESVAGSGTLFDRWNARETRIFHARNAVPGAIKDSPRSSSERVPSRLASTAE